MRATSDHYKTGRFQGQETPTGIQDLGDGAKSLVIFGFKWPLIPDFHRCWSLPTPTQADQGVERRGHRGARGLGIFPWRRLLRDAWDSFVLTRGQLARVQQRRQAERDRNEQHELERDQARCGRNEHRGKVVQEDKFGLSTLATVALCMVVFILCVPLAPFLLGILSDGISL